jgi:hypothetical protein
MPLDPKNLKKLQGFLRFLQMQVFGSLKLSMALLGSSWPLLGPIWSQNCPQNGPQNGPKVVQKMVQKTTPKKVNFKPILDPKMHPKITQKLGAGARAEPAGALLKALVFKMAPRWLKMASSSPR